MPPRHLVARLAAAAALVLPLAAAQAACMTDEQVAALHAAYQARTPAANPDGLATADGECSRAKFQALLARQLGAPVGYKAGLTNPAVQKRFNADAPVWGTLYAPMLLPADSKVDPAFGARALYEADLLVRVKDKAINDAATPAQVLAQVDQVIPFIELPDLMVETPAKINGAVLSALNVGTRLGVQGAPLLVPADAAGQARLLDQLRDMNVRLVDGQGAALGGGKGSDVLGHPLNAVVWLAQALKAQGLALRPGQVVSLGSFSALLPPKAGLKVTVHYDGVPGLQPATVSFK